MGITLATISTAQPVLGAWEIAASVSPEQGTVGRPIEVLVRTFVPIGGADVGLPVSALPYPAPSGLWNVLYPIPDYPFDVVATPEAGDSIPVTLSRDPADASLWRGSFTPMTSGEWLVSFRNFPTVEPIRVPVSQTTETRSDGWTALLTLIVGLAVGVVLSRVSRLFRQSTS